LRISLYIYPYGPTPCLSSGLPSSASASPAPRAPGPQAPGPSPPRWQCPAPPFPWSPTTCSTRATPIPKRCAGAVRSRSRWARASCIR